MMREATMVVSEAGVPYAQQAAARNRILVTINNAAGANVNVSAQGTASQ